MKKLLLLAGLTLSAASTFAATYTWQTAGSTDTWSASGSDTNWYVDAGTTLSPWGDGNDAVFSGTGETVTLSGTVAPSSVMVGAGDGDWTFAVSAGNIIGGSGVLTKTGSGTLAFTGSGVQNAFDHTVISQGTITFSSVSGGGFSQLGGNSILLNDANTGSANTVLLASAGQQLYQPIVVQNFGSGTTTIGATAGMTGTAWFSNTITANKAVTLQSGGTGNDITKFGTIAGSGDITIANGGAVGTRIIFDQQNTNTGNLTIDAGARLQLSDGSARAVSMIGDSSTVTVAGDGTGTVGAANGMLRYAKGAGNSETFGALAGGGIVDSAAGSGTFFIGNGGASATFDGKIINGAGVIAITKIGSGSQTFSNANTYTGGTTISDGTLVAGNASALGAGNVIVNAGSLKIGYGGSNTVTLASGATLAVAGGATLAFSALDTSASAITMAAGAFTLGNGVKIDITGLNLAAGSYTLISGAAAGSTLGTWNVATDLIGGSGSGYSLVASGGTLTLNVVPEPGTYGLFGAGALAGIAFIRRRRR